MASEIAAILGFSDYETPFQRWQRKLGLVPDQEETPAMRRGKELEHVAREIFHKETGIVTFPLVGESETHSWMAASLDGYNEKKKCILEIKCNGTKNHAIALGSKVPYPHWLQMQQQMFVAGVDMGYYYSFDGKEGMIIEVEFDKNQFNSFIPQLYQFFRGMILLEAPALTVKDYKDMSGSLRWKELSDRYILLDAEIKRKLEEKDKIRKSLIQLCDETNCRGNGIKLLKTFQKGRIDYDSIELLKQIDLDKHRRESTTSWRVYVE